MGKGEWEKWDLDICQYGRPPEPTDLRPEIEGISPRQTNSQGVRVCVFGDSQTPQCAVRAQVSLYTNSRTGLVHLTDKNQML